MDFAPASLLRDVMDDDTRTLIDRLCTRAGSVMEDISVIALTTRALSADQIVEVLDQIERDIDRMSSCIRAARTLAG